MVFKELEIQGFKSFPDKVKITFDEGVTGGGPWALLRCA